MNTDTQIIPAKWDIEAPAGSEALGYWHIKIFSRVVGDARGCWNWQGYRDKEGYGKLKLRGKSMLAHRASFLVVNGYLPKDKLVCHSCDNPSCINPQHLFLGSNYDNTMDAVRKGRKFIPPSRGSLHSQARLTDSDVLRIRALCKDGQLSQRQIAEQFSITQPTVSDINRKKSWSHL